MVRLPAGKRVALLVGFPCFPFLSWFAVVPVLDKCPVREIPAGYLRALSSCSWETLGVAGRVVLVLVLGRGEVCVVDMTPVGHFDDSWPFVLVGEFYPRSCVSCCQ